MANDRFSPLGYAGIAIIVMIEAWIAIAYIGGGAVEAICGGAFWIAYATLWILLSLSLFGKVPQPNFRTQNKGKTVCVLSGLILSVHAALIILLAYRI